MPEADLIGDVRDMAQTRLPMLGEIKNGTPLRLLVAAALAFF